MNNSVSGMWRIIHRRDIPPSPGCTASGFIEQLSIQATDTSIFAIAVVTVWSLTRETMLRETLPRLTTFLMCASTWILPISTAFTALGMHKYTTVSGNWCWLSVKPTYYRYVLMHGWRFAFIIGEILMYTYLHIYLRRRFASFVVSNKLSTATSATLCGSEPLTSPTFQPKEFTQGNIDDVAPDDNTVPIRISDGDREKDRRERDLEAGITRARTESWVQEAQSRKASKADKETTTEITAVLPTPQQETIPESRFPPENYPPQPAPKRHKLRFSFNHPFAHRGAEDNDLDDHEIDPRKARLAMDSEARSRRVRRVLLLNAYPAMYILLWIPGIANRLVEATGHSSHVTQFLQASTQFIGLANAITYGWNERVVRQLKERIAEWRDPSPIRVRQSNL
ncbi:hypothetical protein H072_999 [Dactylellina haptotyla CBS 200.50]|uniref:Glucose receptor Git3-like N-terminal domain-containing protein n=1 Tax=Dactylellina haptotyla (strain CBS 200.50) TaxID=1284197 RepID=S8AVP0_DACHA|nr:hypothetical protein H072_999 [Dactylellina haptotyla CBS 200.50]